MLDGYIGLTKILSGDNDVGEPEFDTAVAALESRDNEDAAFYAKQLVDVRAFFREADRKRLTAEQGKRQGIAWPRYRSPPQPLRSGKRVEVRREKITLRPTGYQYGTAKSIHQLARAFLLLGQFANRAIGMCERKKGGRPTRVAPTNATSAP